MQPVNAGHELVFLIESVQGTQRQSKYIHGNGRTDNPKLVALLLNNLEVPLETGTNKDDASQSDV